MRCSKVQSQGTLSQAHCSGSVHTLAVVLSADTVKFKMGAACRYTSPLPIGFHGHGRPHPPGSLHLPSGLKTAGPE